MKNPKARIIVLLVAVGALAHGSVSGKYQFFDKHKEVPARKPVPQVIVEVDGEYFFVEQTVMGKKWTIPRGGVRVITGDSVEFQLMDPLKPEVIWPLDVPED
ncbi:hypothetical protein H6785_04055 [Candidatus Nomurabacteria bacterium]|nr:hypothetical protein [Candidatus Kaiserbacteria bacterium]MCB9815721.1 hypothetical protein [Candidatus Nomurabacteria bacterium]